MSIGIMLLLKLLKNKGVVDNIMVDNKYCICGIGYSFAFAWDYYFIPV